MFLKQDEKFLARLQDPESRPELLRESRFHRSFFLILLGVTVLIQSAIVLMTKSVGEPAAWFVAATFLVIFQRADSDCRLILAYESRDEESEPLKARA